MKRYKRGCHPNTRKNGFKKGHKINVGRVASKTTRRLVSLARKGISQRGSGWRHSLATRKKIGLAQRDARANNWNEVNPSYNAVHSWLRKHYKKIICKQCGLKKNLDWAIRKGETHSHSRKKYIVLCRKCHIRYDRKKL